MLRGRGIYGLSMCVPYVISWLDLSCESPVRNVLQAG